MSQVTLNTQNVTLTWNHAITEQMVPGLEKGLTQAAMQLAETARGLLGREHGGTRARPGSPPHSQTGHLSRSITHATPQQLGKPLTAAAGTDLFYGRVLEFGKVIRAKGGALVFPLNKAAERFARVGNQGRHTAHMRGVLNALKFKYAGSRRLTWMPSKRGGVVIAVVDKGGRGRGMRVLLNEPMFYMTKRVTVRPHPFMRPAMARFAPRAPVVVGLVASAEWRKAGLVR